MAPSLLLAAARMSWYFCFVSIYITKKYAIINDNDSHLCLFFA